MHNLPRGEGMKLSLFRSLFRNTESLKLLLFYSVKTVYVCTAQMSLKEPIVFINFKKELVNQELFALDDGILKVGLD